MAGGDGDDEITEEQLEALKDKDNISEMMKAFAEELPQVKHRSSTSVTIFS